MKWILFALFFILPQTAQAQFGSVGSGFGVDIERAVEQGTFTLTGSWDFTGNVIFTSTVTTVSTVAVQAPLIGDGSFGSPLGVDSSSVTLAGNAFNGAFQLIILDAFGALPALDGSALTGINPGVDMKGAKTTAEIKTLTCSVIPCTATNSEDFDLYTATGTSPGQWRNSRLGTGP